MLQTYLQLQGYSSQAAAKAISIYYSNINEINKAALIKKFLNPTFAIHLILAMIALKMNINIPNIKIII